MSHHSMVCWNRFLDEHPVVSCMIPPRWVRARMTVSLRQRIDISDDATDKPLPTNMVTLEYMEFGGWVPATPGDLAKIREWWVGWRTEGRTR